MNNAGNSSIDCLGSIGIIEQVWTPFIGTAFAPQLGTTLSQSSVVYHYATAEKAVRIAERGDIITPGYGGKIWVTPQRFKSAAEAEQKLGLPEKPTGYYEIPIERISSDVSAPSLVRALERTNGEVMEGGGIELITETPISVKGLDFQEFPEEP